MADRIISRPQGTEWMRIGMAVIYRPVFGPGDEQKSFSGRLATEPFLAGKPSSDRWIVRIEDMDADYVRIYKRSVHPNANVFQVFPIEPGKIS